MHMAALQGHADVVKWLGEVHAVGRGSITPLHLAAVNGHAKVAESLLAMRSSPTSPATDGSQALHVAAASGHTEVAKVLLGA